MTQRFYTNYHASGQPARPLAGIRLPACLRGQVLVDQKAGPLRKIFGFLFLTVEIQLYHKLQFLITF
jgi:hypothetical protein